MLGMRDDQLSCLSHRESGVPPPGERLACQDIAELLNISPKTVDTCRASLMRKLNIPTWAG